MKNIKLGDQVYEGVETVRLDTAAGGTVDFAPYQETFAAGRVEGYNAGKEAGLEEGFDNGKQAGIQSEYDRFWDAFQNGGAVSSYEYGFAGKGLWNKENFRPKYDLLCSAGYAVTQMFNGFGNKNDRPFEVVDDLSQWLDDLGVILDTSRTWYFDSMFQKCYCTRLPIVNMGNAKTANYTFTESMAVTIDKIIVNETCTWPNSFTNAKNLANIVFEGIIGQDINFSWSPLSVDSMKSVITHLKNYAGTADAGKKTVKFTDACWTALEADSVAPDGNTWRDYVETTLGWLT